MKIKIISVGKIKEKYLVEGIKEYTKRLSLFTSTEFIEVDDEKIPDKSSLNQDKIILDKEGQRILSKIKDNEYVILLDLHGKELDSIKFAHHIQDIMTRGSSTITFVIGGSLGLSQDLINRSQYRLCFSKMTFTHQMIKLFLVEQIYRSFKIINNHTYHK